MSASLIHAGSRRLRRWLAVGLPMLFVAVLGGNVAATAAGGEGTVFRTIDVPGAAATGLNCVNNRGTLLGTWFDSNGGSYGFIEQPGGQPTTFNYPGTTGVTNSGCINDLGIAVGGYYDTTTNVGHGWVRWPSGNFTPIDYPLSGVQGTFVTGINDRGLIVGNYTDESGEVHGFIDNHGTFTTLDFPGAAFTSNSAVNNSGTMIGGYSDTFDVIHGPGVIHGFLYEHGKFTTIDAPGAGTAQGQGTYEEGISSNGTIGGFTVNDNGASGWLLRMGQFSSLNDPNAAPGQSYVTGISSSARHASGDYTEASGGHGFVATLN